MFKSKKNAYSLLEILASLMIVSILIVMLTNILILSLNTAKVSFARASVRENQNEILRKIEKDIRNASSIPQCSGDNENALCVVELDKLYYWTLCDNDDGSFYICKKINYNTPNEEIVERTAEDINVDLFSFEQDMSADTTKKTIVVTTSFSHKNSSYGISNQLRQIVISTRNYSF